MKEKGERERIKEREKERFGVGRREGGRREKRNE